MNVAAARNVAIIAAIAAIVAFVPQGGESATFVDKVIGITITILFLLIAMRLYQMFRTDIYSLGDLWRGVLYASLGVIVLAMAARPRLVDTDAGTLVFVTMLVAAAAGLYAVWRRYRAYRV